MPAHEIPAESLEEVRADVKTCGAHPQGKLHEVQLCAPRRNAQWAPRAFSFRDIYATDAIVYGIIATVDIAIHVFLIHPYGLRANQDAA